MAQQNIQSPPPVQQQNTTQALHTPWGMIVGISLGVAAIAILGTYLFLKRIGGPQLTPGAGATPTPSTTRTLRSEVQPDGTWLTYMSEEAGFRLKYPPTVDFNQELKGSTQPGLVVSVEKLDEIPEELPLGMDRKTALADRDALASGKAQTIGDFASSDGLFPIGIMNARVNGVLSRFQVCSVIFERSLVFYPNDYRVFITLYGVPKDIVEGMPEFFAADPNNCGEEKVWVRSEDKMGQFLPTLAKGEGKGAGQLWYDTFDAIIKTIELVQTSSVTSPSTPSPTSATACEVSDGAFCNVLSDIKNSMAAKNYVGVIAYQTTSTVTCDPDGMAIAICDGVAKGVTKEGYSMGYNESEGNIQTRDAHLASLASYVASNGPFIYKGSLQSGDKGIIEYLNSDASKLFVLYMKRSGATWRFQTILVGGTWGDSAFINLDPSLLDNVQ